MFFLNYLFGVTAANDGADFCFSHAYIIEQRTMGGAGETARAAFDAVHDALFLDTFPVLETRCTHQYVRCEPHRTGRYAFGATDTRLHFFASRFEIPYYENARATFGRCHVGRYDGFSHHGTSRNNLFGILRQASAHIDKLAYGSPDAYTQVRRFGERFAGDRYDAFYERFVFLHSLIYGKCRTDVLHDSPCGDRQSAAGNLSADNGIDQLFLTPLRIFYL